MEKEIVFERKINYYETDRMGVVHHSNYIRFLEEARCFTDKNLKPINLKKYAPKFNSKIEELMK